MPSRKLEPLRSVFGIAVRPKQSPSTGASPAGAKPMFRPRSCVIYSVPAPFVIASASSSYERSRAAGSWVTVTVMISSTP
jgi:hypothetical protein